MPLLHIISEPPGARLYLDRKDLGERGTAPQTLALLPGSYRVLAELEGFRVAESPPVELQVGVEQTVSLRLQRIVGTIHVSGPAGARQAGATPDRRRQRRATSGAHRRAPPLAATPRCAAGARPAAQAALGPRRARNSSGMAHEKVDPWSLESLGMLSMAEIVRLQELLSRELRRRFEKELALVFSDVVGSTDYFARFGDEAGRRLQQRHFDLLGPPVLAGGGRIVETGGDGAFVVFPAWRRRRAR